ncbi:alpha/beta hydrolase [Nocardioides aequoreus]|uniref:alpha/beta hydrolase n=1 Tax=Nocardioides aequoreus TaxID=397278 RepID=UPI00068F4912|nr:alpha/beta hydrolase [Nocardioides aequoreus]
MATPGPPSPLPPQRRNSRVVVAVVLTVVVGLVLVAAGGLVTWRLVADDESGGSGPSARELPPPPAPTGELPATPAELARYYDQELDWRDCGRNECAELAVPLDYAEPDGETIEVAVLRVPARDRANRVGQLVVNPGGPGGSGIQLAQAGSLAVGTAVARRYDIVGFDPRGVAASTPLECGTTEETDAFLATDPDPDTPAEVRELDEIARAYGESCIERSGDLASHVSTVEVAKDMDVLRAALGEPELDYLGYSYGTTLGATYADLFPDHVGRMVLDGAVAQNISDEQRTLDQARGFQTALDAYIEDCLAQGDCVLGDSLAEAQQTIADLLDRLDAEPLPTGSDRELTEGLGVYGIFMPLYVKEYWPLLTDALTKALDGDGSALLDLSEQYAQRGDDGYRTNQTEALYAVNCLDATSSLPLEDVPSRFAEFEDASPVFGRLFAYGLAGCGSWPLFEPREKDDVRAERAAPIVVVGTTRDPATPYVWAQQLAQELESGVLVSRDGDGHTGFNQGNECVDQAVVGYLVDGTVPRDGLEC